MKHALSRFHLPYLLTMHTSEAIALGDENVFGWAGAQREVEQCMDGRLIMGNGMGCKDRIVGRYELCNGVKSRLANGTFGFARQANLLLAKPRAIFAIAQGDRSNEIVKFDTSVQNNLSK